MRYSDVNDADSQFTESFWFSCGYVETGKLPNTKVTFKHTRYVGACAIYSEDTHSMVTLQSLIVSNLKLRP